MKLEPMKPTPFTASGQTFMILCCRCGERVKSSDVLCDIEAKAGSFYCQECKERIHS